MTMHLGITLGIADPVCSIVILIGIQFALL